MNPCWKIAACALLLATGACTAKTPRGQVVATVNGKEVTDQDLLSDARASGAGARQDRRQVLQDVVARELLAQYAHDRKLDAYAGYPSDVRRLQQTFLAQKALTSVVKPPAAPKPADIAAFIAAHPYTFANRSRIQLAEIRFLTGDNLKSVAGADDMAALAYRLKSLNTAFDQRTGVFDTAQLPAPMANRIATAPIGQLFYVRQGDEVLAMVVQSRDAIVAPAAQQTAIATQLISAISNQRQINAEVNRLRAGAKIVYQKGYAPTPPVPAGAALRGPTGG